MTMELSTAGFVLILSAAIIWTGGAFLFWRNLRRQEVLITYLKRMCFRQMVEPSRSASAVAAEMDLPRAREWSRAGSYRPDDIRAGRPRRR
jgi:hypothetical protein